MVSNKFQKGPTPRYELSEHASDVVRERNIQEEWIKRTMEDPERKEPQDDGTIHYLRPIEEYGGRYLRVVVNPAVKPQRIVTIFFDRRLRRLS